MTRKNKRKAEREPDGAPDGHKVSLVPDTVITDPEILKRTILAPFYNRIQADANTIAHLQDELRGLRSGNQIEQPDPDISPAKLPQAHPLATQIRQTLDDPAPDESIHLCGLAPLRIIDNRPHDVLALAKEKLHAWPFNDVPTCWRRLYEEASLYIVVDLLDRIAANFFAEHVDTLVAIIKQLDAAVVVAGAPGRKELIEEVLKQLEDPLSHVSIPEWPRGWIVQRPSSLQTNFSIPRASYIWAIDCFQIHLNNTASPVIIPSALIEWPAMELWQDPNYLRQRTLGGHRTVPVEIGEHYLDPSWNQELMTFNEFATEFLLPEHPQHTGYLAQHDLFAQIPALRNDIQIPDYCYTHPPRARGAAAHTAGLATTKKLTEPLLHAWLGPKGTKTPLHTDPYHNILCQVVGYKYVRLYPPTETEKLYPSGITGAGIDMRNNSQVDVSQCRPDRATTDLDKLRETQWKFPLFQEAKYVEAILGPGESLYVPLGWWHFVESLTVSFSVSFWWN
ncbi:Hypothetical predicted protein [Lecanosticta acicola]|uniref:JmjC domain-containing protein n=1 Tax=Lecanosticta acicola TaxID=111012 RepID=A0AAI8Z848_9PEZI|nr:Hypothetical predicted protein [Lecanosticta acicola]